MGKRNGGRSSNNANNKKNGATSSNEADACRLKERAKPSKAPSDDEYALFVKFWCDLSTKERLRLLSVDCISLLNNLKEECNGICTCSVCGGQRSTINAEIERLFKLYCEEITCSARRPLCQALATAHRQDATAEECANLFGTHGITLSGHRLSATEQWLHQYGTGIAAVQALDKISRMSCRVRRTGVSLGHSGNLLDDDYDSELTDEEDEEDHDAVVSGFGDEPAEEDYPDEDDDEYEDLDEQAELRHWDESKKLFLVHVAKLMTQNTWLAFKEKLALEMQRRLLEAEDIERRHQEKEKQKKLKQQQEKEARKQKQKEDREKQQEAAAKPAPKAGKGMASPPSPPPPPPRPPEPSKEADSDEEEERRARAEEARRKNEEKQRQERERKKELQKRKHEREKEKKKQRAAETAKHTAVVAATTKAKSHPHTEAARRRSASPTSSNSSGPAAANANAPDSIPKKRQPEIAAAPYKNSNNNAQTAPSVAKAKSPPPKRSQPQQAYVTMPQGPLPAANVLHNSPVVLSHQHHTQAATTASSSSSQQQQQQQQHRGPPGSMNPHAARFVPQFQYPVPPQSQGAKSATIPQPMVTAQWGTTSAGAQSSSSVTNNNNNNSDGSTDYTAIFSTSGAVGFGDSIWGTAGSSPPPQSYGHMQQQQQQQPPLLSGFGSGSSLGSGFGAAKSGGAALPQQPTQFGSSHSLLSSIGLQSAAGAASSTTTTITTTTPSISITEAFGGGLFTAGGGWS
eukprot:PhM_4_TR2014/c0_g1_i1/m.13410